jgi:hypothetical protein
MNTVTASGKPQIMTLTCSSFSATEGVLSPPCAGSLLDD